MATTELTTATAARNVQMMRLAFIGFGVMLMLLAYKMPAQELSAADSSMELVITVVALVDVLIGFFLPRTIAKTAAKNAQTNPQISPQKGWMTGCILGLAFFQSCNLFAFTLHLLGARSPIVALLFTVGTLSMIVWNPGKPPAVVRSAVLQR
jgi:uncharacterized protein YneF (UPF0154 family)